VARPRAEHRPGREATRSRAIGFPLEQLQPSIRDAMMLPMPTILHF
jgi:hypothetical protein